MKPSVLWLASVTASLLIGICSESRAEYKVATIDVNRVLNEVREAQGKRKELEQRSAEIRSKIQERSKSLKSMEDKLKEASPDSKEAQKFRSDARELDRLVKDSEEELKSDFMKFNKALAEKVLKVISEYAKANGIDLVLDKNEKGRTAVLYGEPGLDITSDIIKRMNQ